VTLLIQAHPEEEYRRLQKTVLNIPVSNPDKKARFPKEISLRLFPQYKDRGIREHVDYAIARHADIQLPRPLNRKEPQSYRDTPFHTFSAGKQIYNPQNFVIDASASSCPQTPALIPSALRRAYV